MKVMFFLMTFRKLFLLMVLPFCICLCLLFLSVCGSASGAVCVRPSRPLPCSGGELCLPGCVCSPHSRFLLLSALLQAPFPEGCSFLHHFWCFLCSRSYWHLFPPLSFYFLPFFGQFGCHLPPGGFRSFSPIVVLVFLWSIGIWAVWSIIMEV